jgi:acyl-CoA thioesterase-1
LILNEAAAFELDDATGFAGEIEIMSDQDESCAGGGVEVEEEVDDAVAGFVIKIAGGFVGKENFGAIEEGASESDTLLLAAGELGGVMVETFGEADLFEETGGEIADTALTAEFERNHDILDGGESGEKLEVLEHEADRFAAEASAIIFIESTEVAAIEKDGAGSRNIEPGAETEQGRFTTAGRSYNGAGTAWRDGEGNILEHGERTFGGGPAAIGFR